MRATALVAVGVAAAAPCALAHRPAPGIYQVWGRASDVAPAYVRGGQAVVQWASVEPARGRYAWQALDAQLAAYARMAKRATVQVNAERKPAWIWQRVATCGRVGGYRAPQYWDPRYLRYLKGMITALAAHLKASPLRRSVTLVRASPDAIGTELLDMPPRYGCRAAAGHKVHVRWSRLVELRYDRRVMGAWRKALLPQIHVALRAQTFLTRAVKPPLSWLGVHGAWIMGTASDIDPNPKRDALDLFSKQWARRGRTVAYWEPHTYVGKHDVVSWNYWRLLLELEKGVSYAGVYGRQIRAAASNPEYRAAFAFFDRYAGTSTRPESAPGAWIALRRGSGRMRGNFGMFMRQYRPDATSTPLTSNRGRRMIGPRSQRFGRYARRIRGGTTRSAVYLRLNRRFVAGIARVRCRLRVWYLDKGTRSFTIRWGTAAGAVRTVRKSASNRWRAVTVGVPGSTFTGALPNGSDIEIGVPPGSTATLHMVLVSVPGR